MRPVLCISFFSFLFLSCHTGKTENTKVPFNPPAVIPAEINERINQNKNMFEAELRQLILSDTENLLVLVDKSHALDAAYAPPDLVALSGGKLYEIGRDGLFLRKSAEQALSLMAEASRKEKIILRASSAYRSYEYQKTVYGRNVAELGQAQADRESAKPGTSQHQLGTAVDFGSITDEFARTNAGKWLVLHAGEYGWSLSFPDGYEKITGYRWESWHYRYVGRAAASFQKKWFGDIQAYMIEYIAAWKIYNTL